MKTWELVKQMEENESKIVQEYGEARGTMIVNFASGKFKYPKVIEGDETLVAMIVKVVEFFAKKIEEEANDRPEKTYTLSDVKALIENALKVASEEATCSEIEDVAMGEYVPFAVNKDSITGIDIDKIIEDYDNKK